jgi:iron complex outermembrane receptor protein
MKNQPQRPIRMNRITTSINQIGVNGRRKIFLLLAGLCGSAIALPLAIGQTNPPAAKAAAKDEVVQLPSFEVSTYRDVGYLASNSVSATRIDVKIADLPFAISALTDQFIRDTKASDLQELATFASGVKRTDPGFNSGDTAFVIRGFLQYPQHDGVFESSYGSMYVDTSNIERVEVVKGPASLLYGQVSPGGTVNYITKRAEANAFSTVSLSGGDYDFMHVSADINQPLIPGKLLFRINGSWRNDYRVQVMGKSRTTVLSPTVLWNIAKNLTLKVTYQKFSRRETPEQTQIPYMLIATPQSMVNALKPSLGYPITVSAVLGKIGLSLSQYGSIDVDKGYNDGTDANFDAPFLFPKDFNYSSNNDHRYTDLGSIQTELVMAAGQHWRMRVNFDYNYISSQHLQTGVGLVGVAPPNTLTYANGAWGVAPSYTALTSAQQLQVTANFLNSLVANPASVLDTLQNGVSPPVLLNRRIRMVDRFGHDNSVQVEAVGLYKFGWGEIRPLIGIASTQSYITTEFFQNRGTAAVPYRQTWDLNPSSPTYFINRETSPALGELVISQNQLGYASDQAAYTIISGDAFERKLQFVTGVRYNQSASLTTNYLGATPSAVHVPGLRTHYTTPQAGIGYKLTPDLMVYGSYSTSYTLPATSGGPYVLGVGYAADGTPIATPIAVAKPTIGEGFEFGLKTNFLGGRFASTLSAFQVTQKNILIQETGSFVGPTGIPASVTVSFQGSVLRNRGLEYELTYSPLNNWQIFLSATDLDARYTAEPVGYAVFLGQSPYWVPRYIGNLWTRYNFVTFAKGLWAGGGIKSYSRHLGGSGMLFVDPKNTELQAVVGYDWTAHKVKYTLSINGMNLNNQLLLATMNQIALPRRVMCTLSATF